ncbi:sialate O-acetylesterase [Pseudomonas sp. PGPR40]|uniref:sialate O-acetylesterase n=1 Tax=Pseudomonas sp. PGPR40 TaxID=2913476 RepID=UPI001EDB995E|nr:sialate O-acetylesterase [Pseudomonas sp. PGPR40]
MTDIAALESYAGELSEAAQRSQAASVKQHQYIHNDAMTDVVTEAGFVPSLAKQARLHAEAIPNAVAELSGQMADGRVHDSEAAGRALMANGQQFYARSSDPKISRTLWQRIDATVSTHILDEASPAFVQGIVPSLGLTPLEVYDWIDTVVDVMVDADGNVRVLSSQDPGQDPVSYAATANVASSAYPPIKSAALLDAGILAVSEFTSSLYPDYIEVMTDEDGNLRVLQVVGAGKDMTNYALSAFPPAEFVVPTGYYVWLIPNQSNEDGRGNNAESPALPVGMGYMWKDGALLPLADPVNTTTNTGSAWPAFAQRFYELTGFGSVFVPAAVGGTPQTAGAALTSFGATNHWDVGGTLRVTALSRVQATFAALDGAGIMWQMGGLLGGGGERDAQNIDNPAGSTGSITAADYKTAVQGMLAYFQSGLQRTKLPFIMRRLAMDGTGDTTGFQQIRAAQMDLCANVPNIYMGWTGGLAAVKAGRVKADTYDLHFLQQDLNDMGRCMASVAAYVCLGRA